ncbi:uncharacterized protein DNG_07936 [Cephalotrichum gorgonifer]|uniref:Uncharacterized protein n=1 Tax=Cephalotrichum gorgonifer TaxID=2041049 RepID=A0AAE8SXY2_9PEZI|nr:uncharacterized protein DNG_07936 [Cephalotrichum gorgonifer]
MASRTRINRRRRSIVEAVMNSSNSGGSASNTPGQSSAPNIPEQASPSNSACEGSASISGEAATVSNIDPPTETPTATTETPTDGPTWDTEPRRWGGQRHVKVSMLPVDKFSTQEEPLFLHFGEGFSVSAPPERVSIKVKNPGNKKKKKKTKQGEYPHSFDPPFFAVRDVRERGFPQIFPLKDSLARSWWDTAARVRTLIAKCDWRRPVQEGYLFRDRAGGHQLLALHSGLGPGEVEHPIVGPFDWTREWDCVLSMTQWSRIYGFPVTSSFYFKDLKVRLGRGVPWRNIHRTRLVKERRYREITCYCCVDREWVCESKFLDRSCDPQWAAVIAVGHLSRMQALENNALDVVRHSKVTRAELDMRTGSGRYRKVMRYNYGHSYGNDLAYHWLSNIWRESLVAEFEEYFGCLFQV